MEDDFIPAAGEAALGSPRSMERAVLMCRGDLLQPADLGIGVQRPTAQNLEELSLESVESILIRKALQRYQGNVSQAAEALGGRKK